MKATLLITALFLILFEAIPESLSDSGKKTLGGILQGIYLLVITTAIFLFMMGFNRPNITPEILKTLSGYLLLRYAIFDAAYNLTRGLPLFYVGQTKLSDRLLGKFLDWTKFPDAAFLFVTKLLCLFIALSLLLA